MRRRFVLFLAAVLALGAALAAGAQEEPPIRVGILVYDGVYNTEFIAPLDVFEHAAARGRLEVFLVAPRQGAVTTAEGLRIVPHYSFTTAPEIDWLVVPSGENYRTDVKDEKLIGWVRKAAGGAEVVHSNCWGAFLLGAAGLLEGKEATTYPRSLAEFERAFPRARVQRDRLLVDDGGVITSAGGVVSYDAALYMVEKYLGGETARQVGAGLVIDWEKRRTVHATGAARSSR